MITLKVDPLNPDPKAMRLAVDALRRGELVIYPTDTVYGLAADATNESAVRKVFEAKGRPAREPLPVHIGSSEHVLQVASYIPEKAVPLARKYWPGPLTLVLPRSPAISDLVSGGRGTVGVRVPDSPVALALIRGLGSPITGTSANVSGRKPPRTAQEAVREVGETVSVALDAGESRIGVSSTVVDVSVTPPCLLRLGSISAEDIRLILEDLQFGE